VKNRLDANTIEVVRSQRSQPENKRAITEAPGYSEANANYPPVRAALEPPIWSSHLRFIDGRGPLMGRELLRQMVRSHPSLGEPFNLDFERRSGQTVSLDRLRYRSNRQTTLAIVQVVFERAGWRTRQLEPAPTNTT